MTATKARKVKRGKVIVESQSARVLAAKQPLQSKAEVIFPLGLVIDCPLTRTDRHEPAPESTRLPPAPNFAGWIEQAQEDHGFEGVFLSAYVVKSAVEQSSMEAVKEAAEKLAYRTGLTVLIDASGVVPQPAPTPQTRLPAIGEKVVGSFAVGYVQEVASASLHALRAELDTVARGAVIISYAAPDRLLAQQHGRSHQPLIYRLFGQLSGQPLGGWLTDAILSLEPRLLIIEQEAIDKAAHRGSVDLTALAHEHRIAVGVLPGPIDPDQNPQNLKEALR